MRRLLPLVFVVAFVPGCWLFETQRIVLDPTDPTVAAILASSVDEEQLRAGLEIYLGAQLESVETTVQDGTTRKVVAVMVPAVEEALDRAAAAAKTASSDPTVPGLLGALVAALAAAGGVVAGRAGKRLPPGAKTEGGIRVVPTTPEEEREATLLAKKEGE